MSPVQPEKWTEYNGPRYGGGETSRQASCVKRLFGLTDLQSIVWLVGTLSYSELEPVLTKKKKNLLVHCII